MINPNQFIFKIRNPVVYLAIWCCFGFVVVFVYFLILFFNSMPVSFYYCIRILRNKTKVYLEQIYILVHRFRSFKT